MTSVTRLRRIPAEDVIGRRFGRLTVIAFHFVQAHATDKTRGTRRVCDCRCDCGNLRTVKWDALSRGMQVSCGCLADERRIKHGAARRGKELRAYQAWQWMLGRIRAKPDSRMFKYYAGRGISVCERWHSFENFYADMGDCPDGLTLDRIDNDGNYEPANCRWATMSVQIANRRKLPRVRATA